VFFITCAETRILPCSYSYNFLVFQVLSVVAMQAIEPNAFSHTGRNQCFVIRSTGYLYHYRSIYWAMGCLSVQFITFVLFLSTASYQHWNKTTTANVIFHVGSHFRSTCVFLYYTQEARNMGTKYYRLWNLNVMFQPRMWVLGFPFDCFHGTRL
jgi:hypothetical protein